MLNIFQTDSHHHKHSFENPQQTAFLTIVIKWSWKFGPPTPQTALVSTTSMKQPSIINFTCSSLAMNAILISFKALIYFATGASANSWNSFSGQAGTDFILYTCKKNKKNRKETSKKKNTGGHRDRSSCWNNETKTKGPLLQHLCSSFKIIQINYIMCRNWMVHILMYKETNQRTTLEWNLREKLRTSLPPGLKFWSQVVNPQPNLKTMKASTKQKYCIPLLSECELLIVLLILFI